MSTAIVKSVSTRSKNAPLLPHEIREQLWQAAGVSFSERAETLGKAFRKSAQMLEAKKTELVTYKGDYVSVEIPDNASQLKAVDQIFDLAGVAVSKQEMGAGGGDVHVHYHAAAWAEPETINAMANDTEKKTDDDDEQPDSETSEQPERETGSEPVDKDAT